MATLVADLGDIQLAEDAAQDAMARALERWPAEGVPTRPGAWITTVARRRAIDLLRRERRLADKMALLASRIPAEADPELPDADPSLLVDEQLRLMFACCHPALAPEVRVALTLRALGGLTTREIARVFLVPEPTMAQRLVRAKAKIKGAVIPFRIPPDHLLLDRTASVLSVLYLIFTAGHSAEGEHLMRADLCAESIRLTRLCSTALTDDPEVTGLLAMMLVTHARRDSRIDAGGGLVPLSEQNRSLWHHDEITEGTTLLESALRRGRPGPYQLQAAIAALHSEASTASETDWAQIVLLYRALAEMSPSSVITLNLAAAVAELNGAAEALELVEPLADDPAMRRYQPFHATRAELLRQLDRRAEASVAYESAIALASNSAEREWLTRRRASLD